MADAKSTTKRTTKRRSPRKSSIYLSDEKVLRPPSEDRAEVNKLREQERSQPKTSGISTLRT